MCASALVGPKHAAYHVGTGPGAPRLHKGSNIRSDAMLFKYIGTGTLTNDD